jgi:dUTP pyrophosphatase
MSLPILVKRVSSDVRLPERAYPTDSGLDVFAYEILKYYSKDGFDTPIPKDDLNLWKKDEFNITLEAGERILISTGIMATVGTGYEIQVRPRSGLALKRGLTVLNTPGTIDEQYRNVIGVIIINHSGISQEIKYGEKIAQLVVCPVVLSEVIEVTDLSETARGLGGFGSTNNL